MVILNDIETMNGVFDFADKLSPISVALIATLGLAFLAYMIYCEWRDRKIQRLEERIADLEDENDFLRGLCGEKDEQLNKALTKQCKMAFQVNDADARAEGHRKRADDMAKIADEFRRKAEAAA